MEPLGGTLPEHWKRAEDLFLAAADLAEAKRAEFLEGACGDDIALRWEVESLLAYDQAAPSIPGVLEEAATSLLGSAEMAGKRLGPYRITKQLGAGGMGVVYLAVRDDDQYQKQVAIKLVKGGAAPPYLRERLRRERQILAGLDHPYIARLLDGGTTEDGAPYFVLEYVEGMPIDTWCELHSAGIEQRIALFRKACEAISYAHRNLVIHRDLKPGHILVDRDGNPKLLDFGIAKLLDPDSSGEQPAGTVTWVLTPDYASPEQVYGRPVTTATDIYSLGAVLYELLTGVKPHALDTYTPVEVERVVCREEPRKPSYAAGTPAWRKRLSGDLDNIVLMAMRKEPERRYASVDHLSEDLRRHLAGLPVSAREDTVRYRAGKFLKRHRAGVAAAVFIALSLMGGAAAALWEAHRAQEARLVAERQKEDALLARQQADIERTRALEASALAGVKAREAGAQRTVAEERLGQLVELANRSVFDIQGAISALPGATEARRKIAKTTLEFLDGLAREAGGDPRVLRVLTHAYMRLGDVQGLPTEASLGDYPAALASYRKAYAILEKLPAETELRVHRADLGWRIGEVLLTTSKSREGLSWLERGLAAARVLEHEQPNNAEVVRAVSILGEALVKEYFDVDNAKAAALAQAQLASHRKLVDLRPTDDRAIRGLASAYMMVARVLLRTGTLEQSIENAKHAAEIREQLIQRHPNDTELQRDLMLAYGHIGDRLGNPWVTPNLGDRASAKAQYEKARNVAEAMVNADPANRGARGDLAVGLMRIGVVAETPDEREESLAALRRSARITEELVEAGRSSRMHQQSLSVVYEYIGTRLSEGTQYAEALVSYGKSRAIAERQLAEDALYTPAQAQIMAVYNGVAMTLAKQGDRDGALAQIEQARQRALRIGGSDARVALWTRYPAAVETWRGDVYEILASAAASPPERRLEDWKLARDAYIASQKLWAGLDDRIRNAFRKDIERTAAQAEFCDQRVRQAKSARTAGDRF